MHLKTKKYIEQVETWPKEGKHILAQYNDEYIVVYQAYKKSIGDYAVLNQFFGGEFSFNRMTWIKPNFLWMMYRSGWGTKPGQEVTLAIKLKKEVFDDLLSCAVASSFDQSSIKNHNNWKCAIKESEVRLQWDPDHHPNGSKQTRKAIQIGIRGKKLAPYKGEGIIEIEDISEFVCGQRSKVNNFQMNNLLVPKESIYLPKDAKTRENIGLD